MFYCVMENVIFGFSFSKVLLLYSLCVEEGFYIVVCIIYVMVRINFVGEFYY